MYGWGAMNATAVKEAVKAGYPDGQIHFHLVAERGGC